MIRIEAVLGVLDDAEEDPAEPSGGEELHRHRWDRHREPSPDPVHQPPGHAGDEQQEKDQGGGREVLHGEMTNAKFPNDETQAKAFLNPAACLRRRARRIWRWFFFRQLAAQ